MNKNLEPIDGRVLYENPSCLVINKQCGEDSEKSGGEGLFPVHRLDMPVSGCQLLAKDKESAAFLSGVFSGGIGAGRIEKLYWAIVEKRTEAPINPGDWIELIHRISFDPRRNRSIARNGEGRGGKSARLEYRVLGAGDNYDFLEIRLITGRHHQIRAQLEAIGFHIKGDLKYGARRSEREGGIRLHARTIAFPNPLSKAEIIRAEAQPPLKDALWDAFLSLGNSAARL